MHGDRLTDLMTFQSKKGRFCGYLILQAKNETYLGRQVKVFNMKFYVRTSSDSHADSAEIDGSV